MKKNQDFPFDDCKKCKTLEDCPCPDISDDMMGIPLPPSECLNPIKVMAATLKKRNVVKRLTKN